MHATIMKKKPNGLSDLVPFATKYVQFSTIRFTVTNIYEPQSSNFVIHCLSPIMLYELKALYKKKLKKYGERYEIYFSYLQNLF
jgi:hypothetical protein